MPISQRFLNLQKVNNIFLKFHYHLLKVRKIIEIGWTFDTEKRKSKT